MRYVPFARPMIGMAEKNAVMEVLNGHVLAHGPKIKQFEEDFARYIGANHTLAVASCTAGLHLAYFSHNLGAGDEVIVPAQTHVATASAVEVCGAKPVFVDADSETGNIDINQIENAITERTRAISVVHFLGMPVDMLRIRNIADKYNLFVVEDCALGLGSTFQGTHVGLYGDIGVFSFYPAKHITTAEGGMVVIRDEEVAQKMKYQRAFGVDKHFGERNTPGVYDVIMLGFNYRMNEIEAALGVEQLKRVDEFLLCRRQNYHALTDALSNIGEVTLFKTSNGSYKSSYYCLTVLLNAPLITQRQSIISYLNQHGVETSVYYPRPVPHFSYYREKYGYTEKDYPVSARISYGSIALPVGPHLEEADMRYIAQTFKESIIQAKKVS